jgi:hypothetical protein
MSSSSTSAIDFHEIYDFQHRGWQRFNEPPEEIEVESVRSSSARFVWPKIKCTKIVVDGGWWWMCRCSYRYERIVSMSGGH